MSLKLE